MSAQQRRLERVAVSLTPQQAVLAWLEEAHQHQTMAEYSASLVGQPDLAFPLHGIPHRVAEAVRSAMKGQPREVVERVVRQQVRDGAFLVYLAIGANTRVLEERRVYWLHLILQIERQGAVLQGWERWDAARVQRWNDQAANLAHQVLCQAFAIELLAQRYFAGHTPLFPATAAELAEQQAHVEELIWCSNEGLVLGVFGPKGQKARERLRLDYEQLTSLAREGAKALAGYLVHMAKAEAMLMMGERAPAYALVEQHV